MGLLPLKMKTIVEVTAYTRYRNGQRELVGGHDRGLGSRGTKSTTRCISYQGEEGRTKVQEALARLRTKGINI